ncbi:MAG: cytochrome ubiquinol oxidase subunit I [Chloroflexota bacterium]|nr:cytochrome ubiquinol oxidase subunit I [Chloroflexota bacterium]MBI5704745.1 cytochrome ubiquinol oxidase subunit I [Chloroflexota bacterium]
MDPITLSRWQFGLTTVYHFLFVPLTLGLGWFVAYMQTRYYQTRDETFLKMAKFWGKLFLINFAIGVVTGIVQEFQFGMNWSEYSRYVGDIFGAPLAVEALLAFFMESTFLGVWIFGEGRVPEKVHLASIWLVALGSNFSALWILLANGWMQHPVGYVINEAKGRAELVDFFALIANPKGWMFFWHTISSGLATAAFLIIGVSAYHIIRKQNVDLFKRSFQMAVVVGLVTSLSLFLAGHTMGQYMYETQPMKFASVEAHWETSAPADFSIITIGDLSGKREVWSWRLPRVLSFLACNNFDCEVRGVNDIQAEYEALYGPGDYIPLMVVTYWTFRFMMTIGFFMIAASAYFLYLSLNDKLEKSKWLRWMPAMISLPYIANMSGWILTEMGRQPWIVQGLLKVEDAVSPNLTTLDLWISLIGYTVVYGALAVAMVKLMTKYAKAGPDAAMHESVDVVPALVGADD